MLLRSFALILLYQTVKAHALCKVTFPVFLAIGIENPDGKFDANAGSLPTDETEKAAFLKMTKDFFEAAFEEKFGCEFQLLEVSESTQFVAEEPPVDFLRQMGLYFVVTILGDQSENQVRVLSTVTGADSQAYAESVAALDWVQEPVFDSAVRAAFAVEGGAVFECYDDPADNSCGGGGGGGDCFSADDTINVQGRGIVAMKDLAVGDTVMVAPSKFERVYAFGHFNPAEKFKKFIQIHYSSPEKKGHIEMTNNHLLYIEKESHTWTAVKAGDVKVGDVIRVLGSELISGQVTKVFFSINDGVYMPLTESGDIIVNDVLASSYISLDFAPNVVNHPLIQGWLSGDMLMHLWLAPYRIYCLGVQSNGCVIAGGENGIPHYLLLSRWLADFGNNQNMLVQFMMGIPLLVVLGCVFALEASVGPSMVPLLLAIVTVFIFRFQADVKNKAQSGKKRV